MEHMYVIHIHFAIHVHRYNFSLRDCKPIQQEGPGGSCDQSAPGYNMLSVKAMQFEWFLRPAYLVHSTSLWRQPNLSNADILLVYRIATYRGVANIVKDRCVKRSG